MDSRENNPFSCDPALSPTIPYNRLQSISEINPNPVYFHALDLRAPLRTDHIQKVLTIASKNRLWLRNGLQERIPAETERFYLTGLVRKRS